MEEESAEPPTETKTCRCFPVNAKQRSILQGCRALVERRFDVRVQPPSKDSVDGRGTVTGAPEDVAYALDELRRLLCPAANPGDTAACVTKVKGAKRREKGSKDKEKGSKVKEKEGNKRKAKGKENKESKDMPNNKKTTGKQQKK